MRLPTLEFMSCGGKLFVTAETVINSGQNGVKHLGNWEICDKVDSDG